MTDVILILHRGHCERLEDEDLAITFAATNIERLSEGALACTIPADMVQEIEHNPAVAYVRRVHAYTGSFDS